MATVAAAIVAKLDATTAVTDLVSTRIFPLIAPQDTEFPYVTHQIITEDPVNHSTGDTGTHHSIVQIDVWAPKPSAAKAVADAIETALVGWQDEPNGIGSSLMNSRRQDFELTRDGGQTRVFRESIDFDIWHT